MKIAFVFPLLAYLLYPTFASERPNIIFLFADDQNLLSVGCYGNPEVQTPNMDKLGAAGLIFDRHYNTTSICMASRANVMTGMYEYKTGTNFGHGNMTKAIWAKSYPVLLREAGYKTAFAGKFGFPIEGHGYDGSPFFDDWGGGPGQTNFRTDKNPSMVNYAKKYPHATRAYGAFGQDVIRKYAKGDAPFCLSISFKAPHRPVTPDPTFDHIYEGKTFTKPANFGRAAGAHMPKQSTMGRQFPRFREWKYDTDYDAVMAKYYQLVYAIDVAVGMIRDELDAQGITDNTVVIYTSDNGYICGSHGYGSKVLPMEESARVPLMILDPRSPTAGKKRRCSALTGNIDFAPTILELAGLKIPANVDGVSLLPLLENPDQQLREQMAFINTFGYANTCLTALSHDHKYTYWWYGDDDLEPAEELYNITNDPLELSNLATIAEHQAALDEMRGRYDQEMKKWKEQAVPGKYQRYSSWFDRHVPLREKEYTIRSNR